MDSVTYPACRAESVKSLFVKLVDTLTTDDMYSGQRFVVLLFGFLITSYQIRTFLFPV